MQAPRRVDRVRSRDSLADAGLPALEWGRRDPGGSAEQSVLLVDYGADMRAETWALVGVVVGAILGGASQLLHAYLQRRWDNNDAQIAHDREREARLFDHRRQAYLDFIAQFERDERATTASVYGLPGFAPPDYDSYDALNDLAQRVGIFGSESAYQAASEAAGVMLLLGMEGTFSPNATEKVKANTRMQEQDLRTFYEQFRASVRRDLGVDT